MKKEVQTGLLTLATILSASCGADVTRRPSTNPATAATSSSSTEKYTIPSQEKVDQYKSKYYPELMNKDPYEVGAFKTDQGISVTWLNYTGGKFNPDVAKKLFSYLNNFLPTDFANVGVQTSYNGKTETIYYIPRLTPKERVVFIVPESMHFPKSIEEASPLGVTSYEDNITVSYIRPLSSNGSFENDATITLAVEFCQQSVETRSSNRELAFVMQEFYCNSLGQAYLARKKGLSYSEYSKWRETKLNFSYRSKVITAGMIVFSESVYNSIPVFGDILSLRR